jgi:hypothetical protein
MQVKPVVVADMLANASRSSGTDLSSVTTAVQGFLNNVVAGAGYGFGLETPEQVKQSVAAAVRAPRASLDSSEAAAAAATNAGQRQQWQAVVAEPGQHASAATVAAAEDAVLAAVEDTGDDDSSYEDDEKDRFHLAEGDSGGTTKAAAVSPAAVSESDRSKGGHFAKSGIPPGSTAPIGAVAAAAAAGAAAAGIGQAGSTGSSLLTKDAFLVFRALCKLSIRTSTDPTAVRGKVRRVQPCAGWCFWALHPTAAAVLFQGM